MPRSASTFLVLFTPLALAFAAACTSVTGVTPSCKPDVDQNGIQIGTENGCTGYATCLDDQGHAANPTTCCKDAKGAAFTGQKLQLCLFAYGVGEAPTSSVTAASSSASGSGGGGGN